MSNLEFGKSQIYSYTFPAMIAGFSLTTVSVPMYLCNYQVLSIKRITASGTVGTPYLEEIIPEPVGYAGYSGIRLKSSNAGDTSVYSLTWVVNSSPDTWGN